MFDVTNEAVLILNLDDQRVVDANPAAIRNFGLKPGREFLNEMPVREKETFIAMLARVREEGRAPGEIYHIGARRVPWILRVSLMSDNARSVYLVQLVQVEKHAAVAEPASTTQAFRHIPDGFILIDRDGVVRDANQAFLQMIRVEAIGDVIGRRFDRWLRHPAADLSHLGVVDRVKLLAGSLRSEAGIFTDIEISAGRDIQDDASYTGVLIRDVSSRSAAMTRPILIEGMTVEKSTLKSVVQAAVAVVERQYLEAALRATGGNRTAAASHLGLSRQSLYSKLDRYGLGAIESWDEDRVPDFHRERP